MATTGEIITFLGSVDETSLSRVLGDGSDDRFAAPIVGRTAAFTLLAYIHLVARPATNPAVVYTASVTGGDPCCRLVVLTSGAIRADFNDGLGLVSATSSATLADGETALIGLRASGTTLEAIINGVVSGSAATIASTRNLAGVTSGYLLGPIESSGFESLDGGFLRSGGGIVAASDAWSDDQLLAYAASLIGA